MTATDLLHCAFALHTGRSGYPLKFFNIFPNTTQKFQYLCQNNTLFETLLLTDLGIVVIVLLYVLFELHSSYLFWIIQLNLNYCKEYQHFNPFLPNTLM